MAEPRSFARGALADVCAQKVFGVGDCSITKCCTEVCPLVWLGSKIGRRPRD